MPNAYDNYRLSANLKEDAMDVPAFAVEKLAKSYVALRFWRFGAAFGIRFERADRFEQRVAPTVSDRLGARGQPVVLFFNLSCGLARNGDRKAHALLAFFF
jgi:hypothetical protein